MAKGKLTARREKFVREYLIDLNATQAAIRSGYSKKTAGSIGEEILKIPEIQEAINIAMDKRAARTEITADRVLEEFAKLAFLDVKKVFDDNGDLLPIHSIPPEAAAAIAGLEVESLFEGRGEDRKQVGTLRKIKLSDKVRALEGLARHLGLFNDSLELKGKLKTLNIDAEFDTPEQAMKAFQSLL